jgi:hypothetical protein
MTDLREKIEHFVDDAFREKAANSTGLPKGVTDEEIRVTAALAGNDPNIDIKVSVACILG